jgi:phosphorylcholine metabolism protein LicD
MEDLKRLVSIITKRKQRQYPLLELKSINENSSKENVFFRYIKKGIVNTDDDASKLIYGTKSDDDRFRMLKSRLKQKLLNHFFFLDFTENNQKVANQYEQECIQQLHQARMLIFTDEIKIARSLVLKALTTAERCEFTKHIIE